jgi:hypothetical protein
MVCRQIPSGRSRPCRLHPATDRYPPIGQFWGFSQFWSIGQFWGFSQHGVGSLGRYRWEVFGGTCGNEVGRAKVCRRKFCGSD